MLLISIHPLPVASLIKVDLRLVMVESESKLYPAMVFRREKRNTVDSGRPLFIIGMKIKKLMSAKNKLSKKEKAKLLIMRSISNE